MSQTSLPLKGNSTRVSDKTIFKWRIPVRKVIKLETIGLIHNHHQFAL